MINLPSNNVDMEKFIIDNRDYLYQNIIDNIEYALNSKQVMAKIFEFENSPFVIFIEHKNFRENLEHIFDESLKFEKYELCAKIKNLLVRLDKPHYIKSYKKINIL